MADGFEDSVSVMYSTLKSLHCYWEMTFILNYEINRFVMTLFYIRLKLYSLRHYYKFCAFRWLCLNNFFPYSIVFRGLFKSDIHRVIGKQSQITYVYVIFMKYDTKLYINSPYNALPYMHFDFIPNCLPLYNRLYFMNIMFIEGLC